LAAWVRYLVLDNADGLSSLAASLSSVDAAVANGVHWGTWSVLVTTLSHFPKLEADLELLGSERNVVLREDRMGALGILARPTSNLLVSYVLPSVACGPPYGAEES
jgi:hypothetical protein